jgi:DNA polymerase III delta prime subunit
MNIPHQQPIHAMPSSMMDSLKSNMMTMLMINNMNGNKGNDAKNGNGNMFHMIYIFIATQAIEIVGKYIPKAINYLIAKYAQKIEVIGSKILDTTKDITDNKIKTKSASITVTINIEDHSNIIGQALLDHITNSKNTKHISYTKCNYILNQKDVISLENDIFSRMTLSTSKDETAAAVDISVQVVEIYSFVRTTDQLRDFLEKLKENYSVTLKNKLGTGRCYFNLHPPILPMNIDNKPDISRVPPFFSFNMKPFITNRKFTNLFGEEIESIRNRVQFFCRNKKWYDEKGIPYTLGLLISGSPGTGKTSTIKCLANETNRHICNINLNNYMTKSQVENLFFNENISVVNNTTGIYQSYCIPLDQRIYVLEDVDCQGDVVKQRKNIDNDKIDNNNDNNKIDNDNDNNKIDLSFLLNLLDGILENPGRIVIMTSNFPEVLDSALIRPGRIDIIAKFNKCSNNTIKQMIEFFYDIFLEQSYIDEINLLTPQIVTPAEMSQIMFANFSEYKLSIERLQYISIIKEEDEKKEEKKNQVINNDIDITPLEIDNDVILDIDSHKDKSEIIIYENVIEYSSPLKTYIGTTPPNIGTKSTIGNYLQDDPLSFTGNETFTVFN